MEILDPLAWYFILVERIPSSIIYNSLKDIAIHCIIQLIHLSQKPKSIRHFWIKPQSSLSIGLFHIQFYFHNPFSFSFFRERIGRIHELFTTYHEYPIWHKSTLKGEISSESIMRSLFAKSMIIRALYKLIVYSQLFFKEYPFLILMSYLFCLTP